MTCWTKGKDSSLYWKSNSDKKIISEIKVYFYEAEL